MSCVHHVVLRDFVATPCRDARNASSMFHTTTTAKRAGASHVAVREQLPVISFCGAQLFERRGQRCIERRRERGLAVDEIGPAYFKSLASPLAREHETFGRQRQRI